MVRREAPWRTHVFQTAAILGALALGPGLLLDRAHEAAPSHQPARMAAPAGPIFTDQTVALVTTGALDAGASGTLPVGEGAESSSVESTDDLAQPTADSNATVTASASTTPDRHTVRPGETIGAIASTYGISAARLARINGLSDPDRIRPGQTLRLVEAEPSSTVGQAPASKEEAFILRLVPGAQESQRLNGVPTSVTLAQAILETYWGSSFLAREANNYFGIKAYAKPGSAGVVWIDAWEVENGQNVNRQEPFRKYADPGESLVDHGRFFIENSRYAHALKAGDDPREFARRINAAGYATDPAYANKLIQYMDRYNLYQWDLAL